MLHKYATTIKEKEARNLREMGVGDIAAWERLEGGKGKGK